MTNHIPVLLQEIIENLKLDDGIVIDATLGGGGHTEAILKNSKALVIGIDQDGEALERSKKRLERFSSRIKFVRSNFSKIKEVAEREKVQGKVSAIILDIGVSSFQINEPVRGFSFLSEGPLDMRMDKNNSLSAAEVVNTWPEEELANLIYRYGEERLSRKIARSIAERRKIERFKTTKELADFIKSIVPSKYAQGRIHPATRTFQAIRIIVNDELVSLEKALNDSVEVLGSGGRILVISFHSLEDRIVKRFFREMARKNILEIVTKKPIVPKKEELSENPRARSAKLRIAQK